MASDEPRCNCDQTYARGLHDVSCPAFRVVTDDNDEPRTIDYAGGAWSTRNPTPEEAREYRAWKLREDTRALVTIENAPVVFEVLAEVARLEAYESASGSVVMMDACITTKNWPTLAAYAIREALRLREAAGR